MNSNFPHLDIHTLEGLLELTGPGEPCIVTELLEIFESTTPDLIETMRDSASKNEHKQTQAIAHRLKGSASNIGASAMASTCFQIEQQAKTGAEPIDAQLCLTADTLFRQSCYEIRSWLSANITK